MISENIYICRCINYQMVDLGAEYCFAGMFSLDILCSNNFLKSHFGESESAVESCVESCGSFTLV
jgi:hypothetical protein